MVLPRDFQRVWEGWEAGFMAFHAFILCHFHGPFSEPPIIGNRSLRKASSSHWITSGVIVSHAEPMLGYFLTPLRKG